MDYAFDPQTITKEDFDKILQLTIANMNDYEKKSIEVILNLLKSVEELKDNKLRMTKYIVEDIDTLIKLVRVSDGKKEDIESMINQIKDLQSNISKYMETSSEETLESIKENINEINETNKRLIKNKQEYTPDEEKKEKEDLKNNELRYLNERQNKLHQKLDTEIEEELKKIDNKVKPFDFKKLDKAYRNLYDAIESDDKKEIINKRGRLIRLLKANKDAIDEQYGKLESLDKIKTIFDSEDQEGIKLQKIEELLKEDTVGYSFYFHNANDYSEFKKDFDNLYDLLEVNKTRLYKDALKEELKKHGEALIEAYHFDLIDEKHQASVLTVALPNTVAYSVMKLANTMEEIRNADKARRKAELRKEVVTDIGRVVITPVANVGKFIANNWYTLTLLHKGYNTAKAKAEIAEKLKEQEEQAQEEQQETQEQQEQQEQQTPEHVGAEYEDPEFEEEVARLMKTGEYQSIEEAEHQALINLGRIPPDEPVPEEKEEQGNLTDRGFPSSTEGYQEGEDSQTEQEETPDESVSENPDPTPEEAPDEDLNNEENPNPNPEPAPEMDEAEEQQGYVLPEELEYLKDTEMSRILPPSSAYYGNIYEQLEAGLIDGDSHVRVWYFEKGAARWPWNEKSVVVTLRDAQAIWGWCSDINFDDYEAGYGKKQKGK